MLKFSFLSRSLVTLLWFNDCSVVTSWQNLSDVSSQQIRPFRRQGFLFERLSCATKERLPVICSIFKGPCTLGKAGKVLAENCRHNN